MLIGEPIVNQKIISPLDHGLMLYEKSEHLALIKDSPNQLLILMPYNPTCENMVLDFAHILKDSLREGIVLYSLKLRETKTSYAEWFREDNM